MSGAPHACHLSSTYFVDGKTLLGLLTYTPALTNMVGN